MNEELIKPATGDSFWNECVFGSLRSELAEFIDNSPLLTKFRGEKYYQLEDSLIDFIRDNREKIYQEVCLEREKAQSNSSLIGKNNNENCAILGKFKDVEALEKAYRSLEAEFTRRNQTLRELEKRIYGKKKT